MLCLFQVFLLIYRLRKNYRLNDSRISNYLFPFLDSIFSTGSYPHFDHGLHLRIRMQEILFQKIHTIITLNMTTITIEDFYKIRNHVLIALIVLNIITLLSWETIMNSNNLFLALMSWWIFGSPILVLFGCALFFLKAHQYFKYRSYETHLINFKKVWWSLWLTWFFCIEIFIFLWLIQGYFYDNRHWVWYGPGYGGLVLYIWMIASSFFLLVPIALFLTGVFLDIRLKKEAQRQQSASDKQKTSLN